MDRTPVNIVIVGAGFAGVECARVLSKDPSVAVILISDQEYMEYYPAAFRVFASRDPMIARIPVRDMVPDSVRFVMDRVTGIDIGTKVVKTAAGALYEADYLVIAAGSESAYYNIPGASEFAFPFRTSSDVLRIRDHIDDLFMKCRAASPEEQLIAFRFVVVGGGPAGCEIAAGIAEYAHTKAHEMTIPHDIISVVLIEGRERILGMFSEKFSSAVSHRLRALGVSILPYRKLVENKPWSAILEDVQMGTRTVVWTAGVQSAPLARSLDDSVERSAKGKIVVNQYLEIKNTPHVYVLGDIADTAGSGLAQTAIHDGEFAGLDILAQIYDGKRDAYSPAKVSHIVPLQRWQGVVSVGDRVLGGPIGWIARAFADAMYLIPRVGVKKTFERMLKSL